MDAKTNAPRGGHTRKVKDKMQTFNMIMIAGVVIAILVTLFSGTRRSLYYEEEIRERKYPNGFYLGIGIVACIALGILMGLFLGNVPAGTAVGIGVGVITGQLLEKRLNGEAGPFTEEEKQERAKRKAVGVVAIFILILLTLATAVLPDIR
jgi:hypothetical protein